MRGQVQDQALAQPLDPRTERTGHPDATSRNSEWRHMAGLGLLALLCGAGCQRPPAVIVKVSAAPGGEGVVCVTDGQSVPTDGLGAVLGERLRLRRARPVELRVRPDVGAADWVALLQNLRVAGASAIVVSTPADVRGTNVCLVLPLMLAGTKETDCASATNRFTSLLSFCEPVVWMQLVRTNGVCRSTLDQRPLSEEAKQRELRAAAACKPGRRVVIHATQGTTAADLAALMLNLRQDGLRRMTVVVPAARDNTRGFLVLPFEVRGEARTVRSR